MVTLGHLEVSGTTILEIAEFDSSSMPFQILKPDMVLRWKTVVKFKSRPFYPRKNNTVPFVYRAAWARKISRFRDMKPKSSRP